MDNSNILKRVSINSIQKPGVEELKIEDQASPRFYEHGKSFKIQQDSADIVLTSENVDEF